VLLTAPCFATTVSATASNPDINSTMSISGADMSGKSGKAQQKATQPISSTQGDLMYGNYCMYCRSQDPEHDSYACLASFVSPALRKPWFCMICGMSIYKFGPRQSHSMEHMAQRHSTRSTCQICNRLIWLDVYGVWSGGYYAEQAVCYTEVPQTGPTIIYGHKPKELQRGAVSH
jgi:hypothetical protein